LAGQGLLPDLPSAAPLARQAGAIDPAAAVILAALPARIEDISTNSEDPETATPGVAAH
jgi:hypothetical protein